MTCKECGAVLTADDIGAYRKFWERNAVAYLCIPCLCKQLGCKESFLREKILFLKENGCRLFTETTGL